ncbi:hypothetical protein [Halalkalibacter urbisdiaboli]|uniref:hypothetical protein n=1 Tax=Halalkalibacter urbisdiaboli TaxID=1960589 RepID=UPI000B438031|nr:hypothetical protein [Halalkalibacter urbisdiaboli]
MKRFVAIFISIVLLLFLGSLVGMQHMSEELGLSQPEPLFVQTDGEKVQPEQRPEPSPKPMEELKQKRQKVEEIGRFNFFSDIGGQLAESLNVASRSLLSQIMTFVHQTLNGEGKQED